MLSPALHRQPDPEHSRDPRIRALVGQLRTLDAPAPRPEFRNELRAQLVAITPRLVAEGDTPAQTKRRPLPVPTEAAAAPRRPSRFRAGLTRLGHVKVGRPLAVITCVVAVFAVLLGGAVWISKRALPGDALYGLKRASENLQEAMTTGDSARAKLFLDHADTRYDEVADLLPGSGAPGKSTSALVTDTLDSADGDIKQAMQTLGAQAIRNQSGSGLGLVTAWSGGSLTQLRTIVAHIPAGDLHHRGVQSLGLLAAAERRASALKALGQCDCLAHARTDNLGAVPCTKCASAAAPAVRPAQHTTPNAPGTTRHSNAASTAPPAGSGSGSGTAPSGSGTATADPPARSPGGSSAPTSGLPGLPGIPGLPSVPVSLLPSGSGSTCTGLDLGLISVGRCGVGLGKH